MARDKVELLMNDHPTELICGVLEYPNIQECELKMFVVSRCLFEAIM